MKIINLAGGLATRMRPITEEIPKAMVDINGKPFLWYQLELLRKQGISEMLLCVGYKWEKIKEYFGDGSKFGFKLHYFVEKELLGTAGAMNNIPKELLKNSFVVLYGDIITTINFSKMLDFHKKNNAFVTVGIHEKHAKGSSMILTADNWRITKFVEKPGEDYYKELLSKGFRNWVNSSVYILEPEVLDFIPKAEELAANKEKYDFAKQLFPLLLENGKRLFAYPHKEYWREVGTLERYEEFNKDIKNGLLSKLLSNKSFSL